MAIILTAVVTHSVLLHWDYRRGLAQGGRTFNPKAENCPSLEKFRRMPSNVGDHHSDVQGARAGGPSFQRNPWIMLIYLRRHRSRFEWETVLLSVLAPGLQKQKVGSQKWMVALWLEGSGERVIQLVFDD